MEKIDFSDNMKRSYNIFAMSDVVVRSVVPSLADFDFVIDVLTKTTTPEDFKFWSDKIDWMVSSVDDAVKADELTVDDAVVAAARAAEASVAAARDAGSNNVTDGVWGGVWGG
jgi:hypothetical protein